jgi:hypothetical protein
VLSYCHRIGLGIDDLRQADIALTGARGRRLTTEQLVACGP